MRCRISETKRQTIEVNIALEQPSKEIAQDVNVSRRSVQRFSKNLRVHGSLSPPKVLPQGRPRIITPEMQEVRITSLLQGACCRHHALTESHFSITLLYAHLCTSTSTYTTYGIHLVSRSTNSALDACSNVSSGRKRRYCTHGLSIPFLATFLALTSHL